MADGHEKRIEQRPFHRVVEPRLEREHVGENKWENQQKTAENRHHHRLYIAAQIHLSGGEEPKVKGQHRASRQQNQPNGRGLLKIALKGAEKGLDRGILLVPDHFQRHIIYSRGGGPDGKNGDGADDPEYV